MRPLILVLLAVAAPLAAQPGDRPRGDRPMLHGDVGAPVAAGTYAIDPNHTQVMFTVSHMGISPYSGTFQNASGSLVIDPAHLDAAKVTVTLPVASAMTTSARLTDELKAADWFDAARYPTATFTSTAVHADGNRATIDGTLTLHGVTRPLTISARLFGAAVNAMNKAPSIGFVGRATLKRSDFGVTKYVPLVSDEVELRINAAFEKR